MLNDLTNRESELMTYINAKNKEIKSNESQMAIQSNPVVQRRVLDAEAKNAVSVCLDNILGKIYKDALPFDDPKKNCSLADASREVHDYISTRTNGRNSEYYVREAIKRTNSSTLKNILNEATRISKEFYSEKAKDIGKIRIEDLRFNPNLEEDELTKITKKTDLDEISDIIHVNVQKAIQDEVDKAKREDEYNNQIENILSNDVSVQDDATLEAAMQKLCINRKAKVYQPSLFEAVLLGKGKVFQESTGEDIFNEAVHEYTKLCMSKALKLEKFNLQDIKKLANSYSR